MYTVKKEFYTIDTDKCLATFNTTLSGYSTQRANELISQHGKNALAEQKSKSIFIKILEQFKNVMVIILLAAALISGLLGEVTDTIIILIVVVINAIVGIIQESKAEKALSALKDMSAPYAKVVRDNELVRIKAEDLVPGDIVVLEAGDHVPADIRILECASLKIEEASLTGESVPVEKSVETIEGADIPLGDRKNMAYMNSNVTYGRGTGIVIATGMNTEVGAIADLLSQNENEQTPLQRKLEELGKYISIAVIVICILIFTVGILSGREVFDMFLTSISLAVAAIPEGLPAIVTIVLAIGVQKMAGQNAIIRKLPAVETLGSTQIICSDKTGTLTQNKMTVVKAYYDQTLVEADSIKISSETGDLLLRTLVLCNDAIVKADGSEIGDPTETALITLGNKLSYRKEEIQSNWNRVSEIPFDSDRKLMTTIHTIKDNDNTIDKATQISDNIVQKSYIVLVKGAADELIKRCKSININGKTMPLTDEILSSIKAANSEMGSQALRVLATAYKNIESIPQSVLSENIENELCFIGLIGMIDPPRVEVKDAVQLCVQAGIKPVMITGDHKDTATAIAKQLEILDDDRLAITGSDLNKISQEQLEQDVHKYAVYARVSPEHKVRIVKAWKKNGKTVAMTGDGVNDAPALKTADIGVGMGITGTDVSKGVSDMVLSDDNFATIVSAVKEGRRIFSNMRKTIQFLLSANVGEVATLFIATMLGWPILFPIHILWVNLVTDTFPALALGMEKSEHDIMRTPPRNSNQSIFADGMGINIIYQGFLECILTLSVYFIGIRLSPPSVPSSAGSNILYSPVAITMAFMTLGLIQLAHVFNSRSSKDSIFKIGLFTNKYIIASVFLSAILQIMVVLVPALNHFFKVEPLNLIQWLIVIGMSFAIIPIVEIIKLITCLIRTNGIK